jgi:hypothetical protein
MFDGGEWYGGGGPGGAASAGPRVGGGRGEKPISRPSSASSLPDGRRYVISRPASEGGKRPFASFEYKYVGFPESEGVILNPRPKRPRYIDFALERAREPAFFILREAGQPTRPASAHSCIDDGATDAVLMRMPSPTTSERMLDGGGSSTSGSSTSSNNSINGNLISNEAIAHRFLRSDLTPPAAMERTSSGLSLAPEEDDGAGTASNYSDMRKDEQAANRVERHVAQYHQRARDSKAERILKSLISPRSSPGRAEFEIDNAALQSIFRAANEIFFHGCLKNRVRWDWSSEDDDYHTTTTASPSSSFGGGGGGGRGGVGNNNKKIIGTTALRTAADGGYETLIVLSRRYLRDRRYNRRLLISTFLHELIHSYLFVRCGFKARRFGGHTEGFKRIAAVIDAWAGPDTLFLSNMEADLEHFRAGGGGGGGAVTTTTTTVAAAANNNNNWGMFGGVGGGGRRRDSSTMTTMMMVDDDGIRNTCMRCADILHGPPLSPVAVPPGLRVMVSPSPPPPLMVYRPPPPLQQHQQQKQQQQQQPDLRFLDQRNYGFEHRGSLSYGPA